MNNEMLTLTQDWDKTFPQSEKVDHKEGDVPQPLRYHACSRYVYPE